MSEQKQSALPNQATRLLARQLDFTAADLQANRQGQLTSRQQERLLVRDRINFLATTSLLFVITLGALLFDTAAVRAGDGVSSGLFLLLVSLAAGSGFVAQIRASRSQSEARMPLKASGSAHRRIMEHKNSKGHVTLIYSVMIGVQGFKIDEDLYSAFREGAEYTVYFDPQTGTLLSGEATDARFDMQP